MSVYVVTSFMPVTKYRLQHTCSISFSVHYDRKWDEGTFIVFAGALVRPKKAQKAETCVRASYDVILHEGMLIVKSLLRDLVSAFGPY